MIAYHIFLKATLYGGSVHSFYTVWTWIFFRYFYKLTQKKTFLFYFAHVSLFLEGLAKTIPINSANIFTSFRFCDLEFSCSPRKMLAEPASNYGQLLLSLSLCFAEQNIVPKMVRKILNFFMHHSILFQFKTSHC